MVPATYDPYHSATADAPITDPDGSVGQARRHQVAPSGRCRYSGCQDAMSRSLLESLAEGAVLADGAVGSYLFELTGRLSEPNHVYEALNVDRSELVRWLHVAYLEAGARCLTTNTFAANATHLQPLGLQKRVAELNRAGVRRAREAIAAFSGQHDVEADCFILGSIGPTRDGGESAHQINGIYRDPILALVDEQVDGLLLETFTDLDRLLAVLEVIAGVPEAPPVVAQMSLRQTGPEGCFEQDPGAFVEAAAALGARVVGVNCCGPWEATSFLQAVRNVAPVAHGQIHLSAMPNAGGFQRIGNRYMTRVNPEYMGQFARGLARSEVRMIGGCCEVHPPHIREMANYLRTQQAGRQVVCTGSQLTGSPVGDDVKQRNGRFSSKIKRADFAVSVEMLPSRGTDPATIQRKADFVAELAASGRADALDVTDGSRGICLMSPGQFISLVRERLGWGPDDASGLEFIAHFTSRDLNVMGLQSRLIGYWVRQIRNVLFITGDPPKMSPGYPRSTAVFDLDSTAMIHYTHRCLNSGVDFGGQPLGRHSDPRTGFTIGSGFEPEAVDLPGELEKLHRKIDRGADYIMTQPAFSHETLAVLEPWRLRIPILVGVMILRSLDHARRVAEVPGVVVPPEVFERLGAWSAPADQAKAGIQIAVEQARWVRQQGWAGLYLMSPASHEPVLEVLAAS